MSLIKFFSGPLILSTINAFSFCCQGSKKPEKVAKFVTSLFSERKGC